MSVHSGEGRYITCIIGQVGYPVSDLGTYPYLISSLPPLPLPLLLHLPPNIKLYPFLPIDLADSLPLNQILFSSSAQFQQSHPEPPGGHASGRTWLVPSDRGPSLCRSLGACSDLPSVQTIITSLDRPPEGTHVGDN